MVKINRKEGLNETTTDGSYIGAGGVDPRPFDRNPHFMLDWELLIPITIAIVLGRLRSIVVAGRGILPYGAWNMTRTMGQYRRCPSSEKTNRSAVGALDICKTALQ